jgi:Pyruvate/2-oxoacid:ferredoxin oxidoreductase delta subunit
VTLSRKEFFRQGFASLGRAAIDLAGALKGDPGPAPGSQAGAGEAPLQSGPHLVAVPVGEDCLARSYGCFSCSESCRSEAIAIVFGQGIVVDPSRCDGCGACAAVCPITPRSVALVPRQGGECPGNGLA